MTEINEFYEREYNTTISVPNEMDYINRWIEDSALARHHLAGHLDLAYGMGDKETLDLFPAPECNILHVHIHGGFWRVMDKADASWIAPPFVQQGISVAILNYALCPSVTLGTIVDQCRRAVAWLYHNAANYGVESQRIVVSGHSAGGHLVAMLFATDWAAYDVPGEAIIGGIALSGIFDLEPVSLTSINKDVRLDAQAVETLSPIGLQPQIAAPLIVAVGALESSEFRRQSQLICDVWGSACVGPLFLEDCHHFNILDPLAEMDSRLWSI